MEASVRKKFIEQQRLIRELAKQNKRQQVTIDLLIAQVHRLEYLHRNDIRSIALINKE